MPCDRRLGSFMFVRSTGRRGASGGDRDFLVRYARADPNGPFDWILPEDFDER